MFVDYRSRVFPRALCVSPLVLGLALSLGGCDRSEDQGDASPGIKDGDDDKDDKTDDNGNTTGGDPGSSNNDDVLPDPNQEDPDAKPKEPEGVDCDEVKHKPCDQNSDDPLHAIGINCPDSSVKMDASFMGSELARGVRTKFGTTKAFDAREGERYLVLGTGKLANLDRPERAMGVAPVCSAELGTRFDLPTLPAPMKTKGVGDKTCDQDPSLVGKGDCSNSIGPQWNAAATAGTKLGAYDYSELRVKVTVPDWAKSLSFDFAFMTVEYPDFFKLAYNDFFVVWLESKKWTGNISFDKNGKPISLNAGFFDFKDSTRPVPNDPECTNGCDAPELHNTCLAEHASTKWLTTTVGVTPGEEIELIFAIVDLGDSSLDSYAFIDNFQWGCDEKKKPETDPPPI